MKVTPDFRSRLPFDQNCCPLSAFAVKISDLYQNVVTSFKKETKESFIYWIRVYQRMLAFQSHSLGRINYSLTVELKRPRARGLLGRYMSGPLRGLHAHLFDVIGENKHHSVCIQIIKWLYIMIYMCRKYI